MGAAFVDADGNFTLQFIAEVFRNRIYLEGLRNAFLLGVASTVLTLAIALPLALISNRFAFPGKKLFSALVLVPMILPPFVGDLGLRQILGQFGTLTVPAITNSLKYASFSTLIDLSLGVAIAYVIVRTKIPGRNLLDAMKMLPLAVPGLVLAFGYVSMTQEGRLFSAFNPGKAPTLLLIVAYSGREF